MCAHTCAFVVTHMDTGAHVCVCAYAYEEQRSISDLVSWEAICLFETGSLIGPEFTK